MKTLRWLCVLLLATASAFGQGKPMDKDFAALSIEPGDPPVLVNNSNRAIIAYNIRRVYANGSYGNSELVTSFFDIRKGSPPIIPAHSQVPLKQSSSMQVAPRSGPNATPVVGANLYAVVFEDGEVVAEDETRAKYVFDTLSAMVNGEQDAHAKLLKAIERADKLADKTAAKRERDAGWLEVEKTAERADRRDWGLEDPRYVEVLSRKARELVSVRNAPLGGEDKAIELAKGSQRYPKIWRKQK